MNGIEKEIRLLQELAESGSLPGYPEKEAAGSFYELDPAFRGLTAYDSGELQALEKSLKELWKNEPQLLRCIPLLLAAVEKSRGREEHALAAIELYNYTM